MRWNLSDYEEKRRFDQWTFHVWCMDCVRPLADKDVSLEFRRFIIQQTDQMMIDMICPRCLTKYRFNIQKKTQMMGLADRIRERFGRKKKLK